MSARSAAHALKIAAALTASTGLGCALEPTDVPNVTGPSGFAYSISAAAQPAELPRDGRSQTSVTIEVRGPDGLAAGEQRLVLTVSPPTARLSAADLVTDARGQASVVVTAPAAGSTGNEIAVSITAVSAPLSGPPPRVFIIPLLGPPNRTRPSTDFTVSPAEPEAGSPVTFDATSTHDEGLPCESVCAFDWRFGDGATATGSVVSHRFLNAGSYVVWLTVTDVASSTAETTRTVTVHAVAPPSVALTVSPSAPVAGQQVSFTAAATVPRGHRIVAYEWDFGDGNRQSTSAATTLATYRTAGRYTATVVAIDDLGQRGSAAVGVIVADAFAFPDPIFTISPAAPAPRVTAVFSGAGVAAANGASIVLYEWDFGDGSPPATHSGSTTRHAFREPGTYTIRLTVTDSLNRVATRTRDVTIIGP